MNIKMLRALHEQRPFVPFTICLADGRTFNVPHNEFLALFPSGRAAIVMYEDDGFTLIDLLMVTALDVKQKAENRSRKTSSQKRK